MTMDAGAIARACAERLWAEDAASNALDMQLISVEPGRATIAMTITDKMVNGHNICHGGYIFTLADTAFAYASNTTDQRHLAQQCAITYLNPGRLGDRLTARGVEKRRAARSGIYDVTVTREDGTVIAEFRGHSRAIEGKFASDEKG
jgi:acyl-CoA thioesterase